MMIRMNFAIAFAVALLAGCAANTSQQATAVASNCEGLGDVSQLVADLYASKVSAVKPVHRKDFIARAIQPRYVAGAEIYVPGEQGMNEAYLDRVLSCHANSNAPSAHPNDPLRIAGLERVDVDTVGSNYRVTVTGRDKGAGKAIWQSARMLKGQGSNVQVQQLASALPAGDL